jgi:hypothetical protein
MNELKQTERYKYRETQKRRCYEVWYKSNQIQERHRMRKYIVQLTLLKEEKNSVAFVPNSTKMEYSVHIS